MQILLPISTNLNEENIPFSLSLADIEFIQQATSCFMQVLKNQSDVADMEPLFKKQYDNIQKACKTAINWALGFNVDGDDD